MPSPLKDLYSKSFLRDYSDIMFSVYPDFDQSAFLKTVFSPPWSEMELKQRMRRISTTLHHHLPEKFDASVEILLESINFIKKNNFSFHGIEFIFIPDFIEMYGLRDFKTSMKAMEKITPFISCEFAVRPFILEYEKDMLSVLKKWSENENHHVRRLSSEGCRPRLPWAIALPNFKKDPKPILPVLENLRLDDSEYVRRSVANNLNDISKDHPGLVFQTAKKWMGQSVETDALLKHGMRTLLKSNYPGVMNLFGFEGNSKIELLDFKLAKKRVKTGDKISFSFKVRNKSLQSCRLRLEYAIFFRLSNGNHGKKVFKISERSLEKNQTIEVLKSHSFRPITTRKYYSGKHYVSVILNGEEKGKSDFVIYS